MKIDKQRILNRFEEIKSRLEHLRERAKIDKVKFLTDHLIYSSTERDLQVAIQSCLDIANHLVAVMSLERPKKEPQEVFPILADNNIIPVELAEKLRKMAGQRNILVHEYLDIEKEIIYQTINQDLGDIVQFVQHIQQFLDKH